LKIITFETVRSHNRDRSRQHWPCSSYWSAGNTDNSQSSPHPSLIYRVEHHSQKVRGRAAEHFRSAASTTALLEFPPGVRAPAYAHVNLGPEPSEPRCKEVLAQTPKAHRRELCSPGHKHLQRHISNESFPGVFWLIFFPIKTVSWDRLLNS